MPGWLRDTVFYEVYPSSFRDSNGDGIGDINGIIEKLDYIKSLGCGALWINPVFDSPFRDGGYDVRDYKKVAERFGTNEDLVNLFNEAHSRGMKILLDLVPGHTSDEHPWFKASCRQEKNEYSGRYVWTSHAFEGIPGHPYISGTTDREGAYMLNFFAFQPALNYGWLNRTEKWMSAPDSEEAVSTREALKDIMRFWLDQGCDGFRVDMADSLVKNDDDRKSATAAVWREIREMMDRDYPEAALVSEWSNPVQALNGAGFHMDFYLDHLHNGYNTLLRDYEAGGEDNSFFRKKGKGDITRFLDDYMPKYRASRGQGYISMFTCNHDTYRPARTLSEKELKLAYAFILTMPGVPFIYYGDEIGMKYRDLPTKEGGYHRTGTRTPMQWDHSAHMGFSDNPEAEPYLPLPDEENAVTVEDQLNQPHSLLNTVKELIVLRHRYKYLQADALFEPVNPGKEKMPFIYRRGSLILAVNPSGKRQRVENSVFEDRTIIYKIGKAAIDGSDLIIDAQSFMICK